MKKFKKECKSLFSISAFSLDISARAKLYGNRKSLVEFARREKITNEMIKLASHHSPEATNPRHYS
jgi:hypothetical protein